MTTRGAALPVTPPGRSAACCAPCAAATRSREAPGAISAALLAPPTELGGMFGDSGLFGDSGGPSAGFVSEGAEGPAPRRRLLGRPCHVATSVQAIGVPRLDPVRALPALHVASSVPRPAPAQGPHRRSHSCFHGSHTCRPHVPRKRFPIVLRRGPCRGLPAWLPPAPVPSCPFCAHAGGRACVPAAPGSLLSQVPAPVLPLPRMPPA